MRGMELVNQNSNLANETGLINSFSLNRKVLDNIDFNVFYYDYGNIKTTELYSSLKNIFAIIIGYYESKWLGMSSIWYYTCRVYKEIDQLEKMSKENAQKRFDIR